MPLLPAYASEMTLTLFFGLFDLGLTAGGSTRRGKPLPLPFTVGSAQSATGTAGPVCARVVSSGLTTDRIVATHVWKTSINIPRIKLLERRRSLSRHKQGSQERRRRSSPHLVEQAQGVMKETQEESSLTTSTKPIGYSNQFVPIAPPTRPSPPKRRAIRIEPDSCHSTFQKVLLRAGDERRCSCSQRANVDAKARVGCLSGNRHGRTVSAANCEIREPHV